MASRLKGVKLALGFVTVGALMLSGNALGQGRSPVPRTSWGDPDLQGTWDSSSPTPFERPAEFAGKTELTDKEIAELERQAAEEFGPPRPGDTGFYNRWWNDVGKASRQPSMIVDPPDGRLPPLTPAGELASKRRRPPRIVESWEDQRFWDRCLTKGGMPNMMFPRGYNNNTQIVQAPGYVALYHEMIHEVRIIPLDGRPHIPSKVRQWVGDGRGRWDGDTLVIETTNLEPRVSALQPWASFTSREGSGEKMHLVERIRRIDANTIDYTITVNDPLMYTRPWTVRMPWLTAEGFIYEYACHEGNYSMPAILLGARMAEIERR